LTESGEQAADITVIICTFNRGESLKTTLDSITHLTVPPDLNWELIIVDNNSTDNTAQVVREFASAAPFRVRCILERRQGLSAARNAGVAAARGKIIAFTDDDVILHPEWLTNLKQTFDTFQCAAVGGRIIPVWQQPKPDWLEMDEQQAIVHYEHGDEPTVLREHPPLGANCAYRKDEFVKYGTFRLDLGVSGENRGITCEDTEFATRLFAAGEKIVYAPNAIVYHPVDPRRATKAYFRKWYYNDGRSSARAFPPDSNIVRYFGIPRWVLRSLVVSFVKWTFTLNSSRRFNYQLRTYRHAGRIVESFRQNAASDGPPEAP
jgi:glucosyl-dolichyl phosphate glucuronosyltransferase